MKRSRRTALLLFLVSTGLVLGAFMALVLTVPSFKETAKSWKRDFQRPALPEEQTIITASAEGSPRIQDPAWFGNSPGAIGPTLHFDDDHVLVNSTSPALVRRIGDVADSLVSVSAGFRFGCPAEEPDIRIVILILKVDGSVREWNEKRLLPAEHRPGTQERFNFEWLMRDLPIVPDDRIAIFIRNPGKADLFIDDLDIVFRSTAPLKPHGSNA